MMLEFLFWLFLLFTVVRCQCIKDYVDYVEANKCVKVIATPKIFVEVITFCMGEQPDLNSNPVSVHSRAQNDQLAELAHKTTCQDSEVWIGFAYTHDTTGYEWVDESTVDFLNWAPGFGNEVGEDAAAFLKAADGKWYSTGINIKKCFVCEYDRNSPPMNTTSQQTTTTETTTTTTAKTTTTTTAKTTTTRTAKTTTTTTAKTTTTRTAKTTTTTTAKTTTTTTAKTTTTRTAKTTTTTTAKTTTTTTAKTTTTTTAKTTTTTTAKTTTTRTAKTTATETGTPSTAATGQTSSGLYTTASTINTTVTIVGTTTAATDCKKKWTPYGDSCYQLVKTKMTFPEAMAYCQEQHAQLAMLKTQDALEFAKGLVNNLQSRTWIGLIKANSGEWRWLDGESVYDSMWCSYDNDTVEPSIGNACAVLVDSKKAFQTCVASHDCENLDISICEYDGSSGAGISRHRRSFSMVVALVIYWLL